jgi:hypothetical protein
MNSTIYPLTTYTGQCTCGSKVSGFDRIGTFRWQRQHLKDHKSPAWQRFFGSQSVVKIEVKKVAP